MEYEAFLNKEEMEINGTKFTISSIPAVQAQEIYGDIIRVTNGTGDIGMTFLPIDTTLKLLGYAAFYDETMWFALDKEDRINKACGTDLVKLINLEAAMIRKNFGFLFDGGLRKILDNLRGEKREGI